MPLKAQRCLATTPNEPTKPNNMKYLIPFLLLLTSCVKHRDLVNFNEGPDFNTVMATKAVIKPLLLQTDDIVSISVQSIDPQAIAPFNLAGVQASNAPQQAQTAQGQQYLIDGNGLVYLPMIGPVKLAGLSTQQSRDTLTVLLKKYVTDPIVNVRIMNFRFTVLGEVEQPGAFAVPQEKLNVLQALGQAGDITPYGNRDSVLVVREVDGKREFGYVNLHSRDVFLSPYYYLQQNDLVYVTPVKAKVGTTSDAGKQWLQWVLPAISVATLIIAFSR